MIDVTAIDFDAPPSAPGRATVLTVSGAGVSHHIRLAHVVWMKDEPMGSQRKVTVQMLAGERMELFMSPETASAFVKTFACGGFQ